MDLSPTGSNHFQHGCQSAKEVNRDQDENGDRQTMGIEPDSSQERTVRNNTHLNQFKCFCNINMVV